MILSYMILSLNYRKVILSFYEIILLLRILHIKMKTPSDYIRGLCGLNKMDTLKHFVCNYDPAWDYPSICAQLFQDNKCLCVAEKISTNAHVHFQGYTDLPPRKWEEIITAIAATHWSKKIKPNSRPLRQHKRAVDEVGFQYMCKEGGDPLYCQGFLEGEIASLKAKSDDMVDELKSGMKDHLHAKTYDSVPTAARKRMRMDALEYYAEGAKRPRPTFQKDVLWVMYTHPQSTQEWKEFVAESI